MSTDPFYEFGPFRLDPVGRVLLREGRIISSLPRSSTPSWFWLKITAGLWKRRN